MALAGSRPNPVQGQVMIGFELARPGPARLRVLEASGRQVRLLLDARIAAVPHAALWDGRDELGREAPAGVHFYRLEAGATARTGRLVLLK